MAEASYTDADFFLNQLNSCMDQGRCAEAFFRILCNGDALRQKFLGYGTALDVGIIQNIRRGVVEGIAKRWLQDSNCCTPDWQRNHIPSMLHGCQQLLQYLDHEIPILIENSEKPCDLLGLVALFKDESAVQHRLQEVEQAQVPISVGLFTNPENPLDTSKTQTFRQVVGHIFWEMIWMPRFAAQNLPPQTQQEIHRRLLEDVEGIFFPMFDADQSNSIDVMELLLGLIRVFRAFHSYDNHVTDGDMYKIKRRCLSPLFNNLCRASGLDIPSIFSSMLKRMHSWDTLKAFLQSLFSDCLWQHMMSREFFLPTTILELQKCCLHVDPSQRQLYDQHCYLTIDLLSAELFAKLRPHCDTTLSSPLAFFVNPEIEENGVKHGSTFFDVKLQNGNPHTETHVLFLFLWKFMDHFLTKSTSLSHFFNDHHVPVVENLSAIKIEDLISELDRTKAESHIKCNAISLKHWFLYDVGLQHFAEVYTYNATMKNFYDSHFNGAPLAQFESLLFQVDRAQSMADFLDQQRQAEIQHYAEIMYNSDTPTFGRSIQLCPGFSFGLDAFYGLMKRYFRNDVRDLDSTLFKRSCEVWFRCFGGNKSIPRAFHDHPDGHRQMHLNFKKMLLGLNKARQYLLTGSGEHSFALAFELIDIDGNQVLDFDEISRWFQSWILLDMWEYGNDPGAVLEFYFKSGNFHETSDSLPADFRDHLVRFQREGRFFSSSEPNFKEFIAFYRSYWIDIIKMLASYIAVELLNITTAYEFDHTRLIQQTISRQDMSCLLLDAPQSNRFVIRLSTTELGKKNYKRVIRTDGSEQKGFGFLLSLQHLFKRWLHLHGMWSYIAPSNAETVSVQSDFQSEKAQVLAAFQQVGMNPVLIQKFNSIFDEIRTFVASLPDSSCDRDNFRQVMIQLMNLQLCPNILATKVDSLFACFDVDGNGSLDAIEIMQGFRTLLSKNQSSISDLAFRYADSATETNTGPFSGAQNQKLDEEEFKKLIMTVCRDEPYVLQVILSKLCLQELPYFDPNVTQVAAQAIEFLKFYPPVTNVRDFPNPIPNMQHHQALANALLEDPQAGPVLLGAICRSVLYGRKQKSPQIDQHDLKQMYESNQLFGWMLRFWLLRGFLTEDHPQYLRLSGLLPPREIQLSDNIEASEAKARLRHQHLAWYFAAFNTTVDDLLLHLQSQYLQITGSISGQINQGQFEKLISSIFTNLGIRDQIDISTLFLTFDADQSGEISRKEIIDGFVQYFHRIESVFIKILTYFEQKMHRDQNMVSFCSQYNTSVSQFLQKLKSLFISRSTSLTSEIDLPGFCALWKQFVVEFGIRQAADPNIDIEASHMFHVADTSGNSNIDFAELLFFMSEQCVTLLQKSSQERKKIEDLLHKAAQNQDKYGTPPVLGEYTTRQFLEYAWACFQKLASTQKRDPVHFECSKQEFSQLWDELKHQLGFGNEDPSMHIDQVYPHIDRDNSGTISAAEMIEGLIKHFLPRAEASRSQSKAPSSGPSGRGIMTRDLVKGADASASRPPKRPSVTPGSPSTGRLNPADSKLLTKIREEPWYKLAQDEFDSIGEHSIDADDFSAIITRMFEKKKIPIPSLPTLEFMFRTFDTNGDEKLSKTEFLCGIWRTLAFADAAAQCCDDEDDEDLGGEWEGDHMQYLRLAVVPFSQNTMLSVDRLHNMFNEMLELQCTQQGTAWRPSSTLVSLFQRHKLILDSLEQLEYEIDQEHQHIMKDIGQPGKTVDWDSMLAKISTCSFGLAFEMMFKSLDANVEIEFARVCASECPVSTVMDRFFEPNDPELSKHTFLIRQAMRDYLGSNNCLPASDRSYLLRLKNARSASRPTLSVGPSHPRPAFLPSSPPVAARDSPRFEAQRAPEIPSNKRQNVGVPSTVPVAQQRFHVANRAPHSDEDQDSEDDEDDGGGSEEEEEEDNDDGEHDEDDDEDET